MVKEYEVLIIDSFKKRVKVGLQYTQATPVWEGFAGHANEIILVGFDM